MATDISSLVVVYIHVHDLQVGPMGVNGLWVYVMLCQCVCVSMVLHVCCKCIEAYTHAAIHMQVHVGAVLHLCASRHACNIICE